MKPQSQVSPQVRSHRGEKRPAGFHHAHPAIDLPYQRTGADFRGRGDSMSPTSSFRDLSNKFLAAEMKRDYLIEAVCFLIIAGISAWPIVSMVRALSLLK